MARVKTDLGYAIGYQKAGSGDATPIVFLHGVGSDKSVWRPQLDHFGKTRRALAFDYPGYGGSDPAPRGTTRDDYAAAILSGMHELGVTWAHICGLSLGGVVAIALHRAAPWCCASLILADTFAKHPDGQAIYERSIAGSQDLRAFAEARADFLLAQPADPAVRREVIETMARIDPEAYRIGSEAVWLAEQRDRVQSIFRDTLIICGEHDKPTPPALSQELHGFIPNSRVEIISRAGHLTNLEQPKQFNSLVENFIEHADSTARFLVPSTWREAAELVAFSPMIPKHLGGRPIKHFRVHVRDHKQRDLPLRDRTLEAWFDDFCFSQSFHSSEEATRKASETSYGRNPQQVFVGGHEGRMYELGPEVPPDDIDGRDSAAIAWSDGPMFYFLASGRITLAELLPIANALYR